MDFLKNILKICKSYNHVIIMTHKNPDLDGISSALLLAHYLKKNNIDAQVLLTSSKLDSSLVKAKDHLKKQNKDDLFIGINAVKKIEKAIVIIVDTNKEAIVEDNTLLEKFKDYIVIDHHIISKDSLENPLYTWIDENASSVAEMLILALQEEAIKINSLLATFLLAGMDIDTSSFNIKISEKTFKAAAYLMQNHADNNLKHDLLKENKEIYIKKQYFIRKSYMLNDTMAVCLLDDIIYENKFIASIAEELLQFDNVEASFVIGRVKDDTVGISMRSLGKINVEAIASKLGGGGHKTDAACQLKNKKIQEGKEQLLKVIEEGI